MQVDFDYVRYLWFDKTGFLKEFVFKWVCPSVSLISRDSSFSFMFEDIMLAGQFSEVKLVVRL